VVKQPGKYALTVLNSFGCQSPTSDSVTVIVNTIPVKPVVAASGANFCQGDSITLTAPQAASYSWNTGAYTQSIVIKMAGKYSVTVKNTSGCPSSPSDTLVINPYVLPVKPVIVNSGNAGICAGDTITLSAGAAAGYQWSTGESTQSIKVYAAGNYWVKVSNGNACVSPISDTAKITVNARPVKPTIVSNGATTFCEGDSVLLNAGAGPNYLWSNGQRGNTLKVTAAGKYSVVAGNGCYSPPADTIVVTLNALPQKPVINVTGPLTFCNGDSVVLSVPTAATYRWTNGSANNKITVKQAGKFAVSVTNANGCSSLLSDSVTVVVNQVPAKPVITVTGKASFCEGDSTILSGPMGQSSYFWSNGATSPSITIKNTINLTLRVGNANGCFGIPSDTTKITAKPVPAMPTITVTGVRQDTLTASTPATSYIWYRNATKLSNNLQTLALARRTGTFTVYAVSNGCTSQVSLPMVITHTLNQLASNGPGLYPNPFTNNFHIVTDGLSGTANVFLFNELGQCVYRETINPDSGNPDTEIALPELPSGLYVLSITTQQGVYRHKVIKQ
jgi:Secretion system C-terminal sorting domain